MTGFWHALVLVGLAEMGDKTQLVTLAFACRFPPRVVFAAVAVAVMILQVIAVTLGELLGRFLPEHWLAIVSGVAFLLFGAWTLREGVPDESEEPETDVEGRQWTHGPFLTVLTTFLVSELADKSTLATAALAGEYRSFAWIWLGGTLGMVAADGLAIFLGAVAGRQLPRRAIHYTAAAVFILSGVITLARVWLG